MTSLSSKIEKDGLIFGREHENTKWQEYVDGITKPKI